MKNREIKEVKTLLGCTKFTELEKHHEKAIFYADGEVESVIKALREEASEYVLSNTILYWFDGWAVAINRQYIYI